MSVSELARVEKKQKGSMGKWKWVGDTPMGLEEAWLQFIEAVKRSKHGDIWIHQHNMHWAQTVDTPAAASAPYLNCTNKKTPRAHSCSSQGV